MEPEKEMTGSLFDGKFEVVALYCNINDEGWELIKEYGDGVYTWDFTQSRESVSQSGGSMYSGRLLERNPYFKADETGFDYYLPEMHLHIDRYDPEDEINDPYECYRVEQAADKEHWLYYLEDYKNEDPDHRVRVLIRKL